MALGEEIWWWRPPETKMAERVKRRAGRIPVCPEARKCLTVSKTCSKYYCYDGDGYLASPPTDQEPRLTPELITGIRYL